MGFIKIPTIVSQDAKDKAFFYDTKDPVYPAPTLPDYVYIPSDPVTVRVLEEVRITERNFPTAKIGDSIGIGYGRFPVPAKIARVMLYESKLLLLCVWCEGEVDAVEAIYADGAELTPVASYTGTQSQTGDSTIAAAFGQADDLKGVCYSVLQLPVGTSLDIHAVIRGKKVYDPRTTLTEYSANPALALADFISTYTDWSVDWTTAEDAADYGDEEVADGVPRWEIGLLMETRRAPEDWISVLAEYANCMVFIDNGVAKILPDRPGTVSEAFTASDIVLTDLDKLSQRDVPTQVRVEYTLPVEGSATWVDDVQETPDPDSGVPLRVTSMSMPGYCRATHAKRKAVQTLNRATLEDLEIKFTTFDRGLTLTKGDIISVTHPIGLDAKTFRVIEAELSRAGRYTVFAREYNESVYSDEVVEDPNQSDTALPDPNDVPAVSSVSIEILVPQFQSGIYFSSMRASWPTVDYLYGHQYEVVFKESGQIIGTLLTTETSAVWGPLQEGLTYIVEVTVIGAGGVRSTTTASDPGDGYISGKDQPPTDVTGFIAFGIGGEVRMKWNSAVDNESIWRYEIRYGAADVTWDNATFLTRTDSLSHVTTEIPPGTWDVLIKAIDNAFNESTNATRAANIEVDASSDLYLLDSVEADRATSSGMTELLDGSWVVDSGESWTSLFPNAMNTYTNPVFSYQTPTASSYTSGELDPGAGDIGGVWQAQPDVTILAGTPTQEVETYNGSTWDENGGLTVVTDAQKARFNIEGTSAVYIVMPPTALRVDVFARSENGSEQSIGGGASSQDGWFTTLSDATATFQTDGVEAGDLILNVTDGSKAYVTGVTNETTLTHTSLTGGTNNYWALGDVYAIGTRIATSGSFSAIKSIILTANNPSGPVSFYADDIAVGDPLEFYVFGYDFTGESVSEPFLWKVEGV